MRFTRSTGIRSVGAFRNTGVRRRKASLGAALTTGALVLAACGSATVEDEAPETLSKSSTQTTKSTAASSTTSPGAGKDDKDGKDGKNPARVLRRLSLVPGRIVPGIITLSRRHKLPVAVTVARRKSTKFLRRTLSRVRTPPSSMMFALSELMLQVSKVRWFLLAIWFVMSRPRFYRQWLGS